MAKSNKSTDAKDVTAAEALTQSVTLEPKKENLVEIFTEDIKKYQENYSVEVTDEIKPKQDTLTVEETDAIIKRLSEKYKCDTQTAMLGIAVLCQAGGTNASMPPMTKVVKGIKFELKELRETVKFFTNGKGTVRQLAKTMRRFIYLAALQNTWLGPLSKALVKEYPKTTFSSNDLVAAAEFHEDNMEPYMPTNVREALADRAAKIRALRASEQSRGKKKAKKKKGK